jgi:transaldolase
VHSVASFFVSRVDSEVDRRLEAIGAPEALALRGRAAVAQAQTAYQLFGEQFAGTRWTEHSACSAHVQRPLWASTSTKNPTYPDTGYVDKLIRSDTVTILPETTIDAFEDDGTSARSIDNELDDAATVPDQLMQVGVEMDDVGLRLEDHTPHHRRPRGPDAVPMLLMPPGGTYRLTGVSPTAARGQCSGDLLYVVVNVCARAV